MNLNSELIQFMKWYKNCVPIGTQKASYQIVNDYFKSLQTREKDNSLYFNPGEIPMVDAEYYIGIDMEDPLALTYCLIRRVEKKMEVLLSKSFSSKFQFLEDVDLLQRSFNAIVLHFNS